MPIKLKPANTIILIIGVLMVAMVAINILIGSNTATARTASEPAIKPAKQKTKKAAAREWEAPQPAIPEVAPQGAEEPAANDPEDPDAEPINYFNGMDPEDQPRDWMVQNFADIDPHAAGFAVIGESLKVTEEGWTMTPPEEGEKNRPRSVMIESSVQALGFPTNSITPFWKEESPVGTEVLIEVAASPDGENWTSWYPTTGAHMDGEISPTYPDGRPNPNYGFIMGDTAFFGVGLYQFYKYSITLYTETEDVPLVSGFRLYYQDSTMGDGYLVQYRATDAPPEDLY